MNRRSFFGRLAAACGLPFLTRAEVLPFKTQGLADLVLPVECVETAFGAVEVLPNRYAAEIEAALQRMREDTELTMLSGEDNPLEWDEETLARIEKRRRAYTPGWIV